MKTRFNRFQGKTTNKSPRLMQKILSLGRKTHGNTVDSVISRT